MIPFIFVDKELHGIFFKNNNFWLFLDYESEIDATNTSFREMANFQLAYKKDIEDLIMLPVSQVMYAKQQKWKMGKQWWLYDIYKISPNSSLEISLFGTMTLNSFAYDEVLTPLRITDKFQSASTRKNLKGLILRCGLVVSDTI